MSQCVVCQIAFGIQEKQGCVYLLALNECFAAGMVYLCPLYPWEILGNSHGG